jgi:hypothetical protein
MPASGAGSPKPNFTTREGKTRRHQQVHHYISEIEFEATGTKHSIANTQLSWQVHRSRLPPRPRRAKVKIPPYFPLVSAIVAPSGDLLSHFSCAPESRVANGSVFSASRGIHAD